MSRVHPLAPSLGGKGDDIQLIRSLRVPLQILEKRLEDLTRSDSRPLRRIVGNYCSGKLTGHSMQEKAGTVVQVAI